MSWPMQNPGQWNPGMAMAPDMNMGSYTPEQWAAMQQQNWQQWTQWQQQYAQWQSQYGEKYAEQMQVIQAMGGMPPLPPGNAAPPPAPPPPDKPPPPPHENNQPLYAHTPSQPAPVPAPNSNQHQNVNSTTNVNLNSQSGNNSNWSNVQEPSLSSVNAEALKKLAEEERLFDIQFQKWEEEIEKWKKDNVNHPDKQAYKEYEEKFESCRAQLLERRQQMNKKKARLLGTAPPPPPPQPANTKAANVNVTAPLPLLSTPNNMYPNKPQGYGINSVANQNKLQQSYGHNSATNQDKQQQNYGNNYMRNQMKHDQNYGHNSTQNYADHNNAQSQYQQYNMPQHAYNRNNNINIQTQDRYESYSHTDKYTPKDSFTAPPINPSFLLAGESIKKGIPGLDLVPETDKSYAAKQEVIDITGEKTQGSTKGPDYSTISKGINNILGDEKIMNILSMVRGQVAPDSMNNTQTNQPNQRGHYSSNQSDPQYDQGYRNQNYNNKQYDNRQNNMQHNRQDNNYPVQLNLEVPRHPPPPKRMLDDRQDEILQEPYDNYDRNAQYGGNDISSPYDNGAARGGPPPVRSNMPGSRPPIRPLLSDTSVQQNVNNYPRGPPGSGQQHANDYPRGMQGPPSHPGHSGSSGLPERRPLQENNINAMASQPARPKWIDEPMFSPSLIVEYEHKPLRLKARDFIEPVHMFDYNHKSKDEDNKKKDFEKEADELFLRKPRRFEKELDHTGDRYSRDYYSRDYERRAPRDDLRDVDRPRLPFREDFDDRRRLDDDRRRLDDDRRRLDEDRRRPDRYDDRKRDDRDKYSRRDDIYRERDKDRDRIREPERRRDDFRRRSNSHDRESRKRALSRDSELSDTYSKKSREKDHNIPAAHFDQPKRIVMIDDILESPGREIRPAKIVIILRGPPGSGKSYLAKLIRDKEAEHGGTVRIMSIDDYFMQEGEVEEKDPATGKMIKKPTLKYEYEAACEEAYVSSLKKAFKRSLTDGYFTFIIYDAVNDTLKSYADVWNLCRQHDFQVYICTMELDPQVCYKRNIHDRTLQDIELICSQFYPTPAHHIQLDATTLLQSGAITEVQMEDADDEVIMEDAQEPEVESVFTSKWEKMDVAAQLARLDGTSKPLRPSQLSMEDYLQLDDWKPATAKPGKKTVRWADIEERRQQEKMRAIGFVVGQTDWNRMTDPTMGSSALTQTKYIERVRRN